MSGRDASPSGRAGRLIELEVENLALIDALRLQLGPGLNLLTGETGAGKSLLIDALGLVLGARADTTVVRHGAAAARVTARFERLPSPLVAVREVAASGRSSARLDDEAATAGRLSDEVGPLVDVHGQNDQQRLLDERWQRDLLDAYGGHEDARSAMADAYGRWATNRAALDELAIEPREVARRIEVLEHEVAEIESAGLRPGEADEILARLSAARNGETIARAGAAIEAVLVGADSGEASAARDALAAAAAEARGLARIDDRWSALAERLSGLAAEAEDAAEAARALAEAVEHDPREIARLEERVSLIYSLERRYGEDEEAVLAHADRAAEELGRLRGIGDERAAREADDGRLLAEVGVAATALSALRRATATDLAEAVSSALEPLGFPAAAFSVGLGRRIAAPDEPAVEVDGDALAFDAAGIDDVVYRFAPNPGEPARPLARIASGGELSRVALAIREVLAGVDDTPTLVFDEIDTGIGGRSAEPVGRSLWALARRHQVLCVTHLPQIAAYADVHFQLRKEERAGRTVTTVTRLDRAGRVVELAAMIGAAGGAGATASARELLDRAEGWRGEFLASAG
ncbi:MAG TPA: DNA repair protein RecN [Candidatus Limnocylindrales bacterium]|nr:DNA repair protein RecN [Candidatus Limnocylindrales bacterium]